jgi:hypothetical protein
MAITFDATPGSPTANSLTTVAAADDYLLEARLHVGSEWKGLTEEEKQAALIWATREIEHYEFIGRIADLSQALSWPRSNAKLRDGRTLDETTVPGMVQDATAEMALFVAQADRSALALGDQYEKIKVGPIEITPMRSDGDGAILANAPPDIKTMLRKVLAYGPGLQVLRA